MLVLTRRKSQSILVGDDIVVTVLEVKGDQIRLGITAPRDVPVFRAELLAGDRTTDLRDPAPPTQPAPAAHPAQPGPTGQPVPSAGPVPHQEHTPPRS